MILVTGATGTVGSEVVKQLVEKGEKVRAFVRSKEKAKSKLPAGVELAEGSFEDDASLASALRGVDKLFLLSAGPENIRVNEPKVVDAAKKAGVKHVVKLSVIGADAKEPIELAGVHRASEKHLEASGMQWTHLRPGMFMSNMFNNAGSIKAQGKFFGTYGNGRIAMIDPRDIAAIAVKALTENGHHGKAYALTSNDAMSYADLAKALAEATGKPVEYVNIPEAAAREGMTKAGMPPKLVGMLLELAARVAAGQTAFTSPDFQQVMGRAPRKFGEWAKEHAAAFR